MVLQIRRMFRNAVFFPVLGGGAKDQPHWRQLAGDQCRVWQAGDADGGIKPFVKKIDHTVIKDYIDVEVRVAFAEVCQDWGDMGDAKRHWYVQAQGAARFDVKGADGLLGFLHILNNPPGPFVKVAPTSVGDSLRVVRLSNLTPR